MFGRFVVDVVAFVVVVVYVGRPYDMHDCFRRYIGHVHAATSILTFFDFSPRIHYTGRVRPRRAAAFSAMRQQPVVLLLLSILLLMRFTLQFASLLRCLPLARRRRT